MTGSGQATVVARRQGRAGRITLSRPHALNALDQCMIHAIDAALETWRDDPAIHLVVLDSASDRAFCAGGDIRVIRDWVLDGRFDAVEAFFIHEYALNRTIARYPKPYVSLVDGICMGGGIGLSAHGSALVVSEHAQFAMPEVQLGLFPDVGASFFLPRLRCDYGMYLGLSGARATGADACWLGLATHFVPRASMSGLAEALANDGLGALTEIAQPPPSPDLPPADQISSIFTQPTLAEVTAGLERIDASWAKAALASMGAASPSALRWTFDLLRDGAHRTLEQCQRAELELTWRATRHPDFAEGVRAMVVDKDRQPHWVLA